MTQSSGQQTTQQQSVSQPWAPTIPLLSSITNNLGGVNYAPTAAQNAATSNLVNSAQGIPNYGPTVGNVANNYLTGGANAPLANAASAATNTLSPYLNSGYLNPMTTPGLSDSLKYIQQQVANNVNGQFAGAGRDLSPANSQAAAYGEMGALAPILTNQYNQNVGAQQNAAQNTFNIANAANQAYLQNAGFGVNTAGNVAGAYTAPGQAQYGAANTQYGTPLANVGGLTSLLLPIAGLGGLVNSQGQTNTTLNPSLLSSVLSPFSLFSGGTNSPFSGFTGALGSGLNFFKGSGS